MCRLAYLVHLLHEVTLLSSLLALSHVPGSESLRSAAHHTHVQLLIPVPRERSRRHVMQITFSLCGRATSCGALDWMLPSSERARMVGVTAALPVSFATEAARLGRRAVGPGLASWLCRSLCSTGEGLWDELRLPSTCASMSGQIDQAADDRRHAVI